MSEPRVHLPYATSLVARSASTHIIGRDNHLPWRLKSDLVRFRERTEGHVVVMGRRTFESIGKPLPNRTNIVLSRSELFVPGVHWAGDVSTALYLAETNSIMLHKKDFFVIGGEQIYSIFYEYINKVFLTEVYDNCAEGDAKFDVEFNPSEWDLFRKTYYQKTDKDDYDFSVLCYLKKKWFQRTVFRDRYLKTNPHLALHIEPYIQTLEESLGSNQFELMIA